LSASALEMKKQQVVDFYTYHPDSQTIQIVGGSTFPGLFDHAFLSDSKDAGNVSMKRRTPCVSCYSGYESLITAGTTQIIVGSTTYTVTRKAFDHTDGTYQGELWLAEA